MLTKRIIPCLDVKDNRVVKGINFLNLRTPAIRSSWAPATATKGPMNWSFSISRRRSGRKRRLSMRLVERVAERIFIPFTVGGGISTADQIGLLLRSGADKCSVNTAAVQNPDLIRESAERFGNQCVVLAIDARRKVGQKNKWIVTVKAGSEPTDIDAVEWAERWPKVVAAKSF
jgi:cyclase